MDLEHSFTVPLGIEDAWAVLLDVERIAPCMPGATLDTVDGDEFTGRVKVKVGPITISYKGSAQFVERDDAAHTATLEAAGKEARGSGTAKATVRTTLREVEGGTEVQVRTTLAVTGRPAQFGRGVMQDVAGKLIGRFADCLADELAEPTAADHEAADHEAADHEAGSAPAAVEPSPVAEAAAAAAAMEPAAAAAMEPAAAAAMEPAAAAAMEPAAAGAAEPVAAGEPAPAARPTGRLAGTPYPGSGPSPARPPTARRHSAEPIDLLETAGLPIAKRLAPVAGVLALLALILWRRRR